MSKSCQLAELLRKIFTANANCSYFMSFAYSYLHHALDKNSHVEALYGKTKSRKKSFGKENEKIGLKKNEQDKKTFCNAMFSREIVIYCQRHLEILFFHWFVVLLGVIISGCGASCLPTFTS